jgi:hypothetical protein
VYGIPLDRRGEVIAYWEKFFSFWKNADLGIAKVEDVRKRLIDLKNR